MLGGHLDSWHSATGATDNAIGCAMMMEAARILKAIGVQPRRTIRVALWSGEEEGLLGSQAYVQAAFRVVREAEAGATRKLSAYLNLDTGTGRVRGAERVRSAGGGDGRAGGAGAVRGSRASSARLRPRSRNIGGTDSTSFNNAGLPGISFRQDPIEYETAHASHEPRHLRAGHRGRREGGGDR